jgi:hypothetical protein
MDSWEMGAQNWTAKFQYAPNQCININGKEVKTYTLKIAQNKLVFLKNIPNNIKMLNKYINGDIIFDNPFTKSQYGIRKYVSIILANGYLA